MSQTSGLCLSLLQNGALKEQGLVVVQDHIPKVKVSPSTIPRLGMLCHIHVEVWLE